MGKETIVDMVKIWIGTKAFKVFLWSVSMTCEQYWAAIQDQENNYNALDSATD